MSFLNLDEQQENMRKSVAAAIKDSFPVKGSRYTLDLEKVWVPKEKDPKDYPGQKTARLKGKTFADPIYGSLRLTDNDTGKVVDREARVKLGDLPVITPRGSFIVGGNEYQVTNQLRLKPGVYTQYGADGTLSSQVNLAKGRGFKMWLDQAKGLFNVNVDTANIKLYPVLKDLGVSDKELEKAWGPELLDMNREASKGVQDTEIQKLHKKLFYNETGATREQAAQNIKDYFKESTKIDPENTAFTLGKKHEAVSSGMLLDVANKLLRVSKNEDPEDDRNHLAFKSVHSVDDFLKERLTKTKDSILRDLKRQVDKPGRSAISQMIGKGVFGKTIESLFTQTELSSTAEQINPLHMIAGLQKVTVFGEGGVSEKALTTEARGVHSSHLGLLDPIQTPESTGTVGAMFRLPIGSRKRGDQLKTVTYDPKTGKAHEHTARELDEMYVAFPDQFDFSKSGKFSPVKSTVTAQHKGNILEVPHSKVDRMIATPAAMFGVSVNMMPFLDSTQGNRALTASRMQEQALPLKNREQPLVQVAVNAAKRLSYENVLAKQFEFAHEAPVAGVVKKVDEDGTIHIKGDDGKSHSVTTYKDFPLNSGHFLNSEISVKAGDKVKAGQLIGDTNFTKDGSLALGTNLKVAYLPFKGYNFEDGLVVSESASKKLTSLHMYKESVEASSDTIVSKAKFQARFPSAFTSAQLAKLDEDGVVKVGQQLEEGDPVILVLSKALARPEDGVLKNINKSLVQPYRNASVTWDKSVRGVVKNVSKHGSIYETYVETEEAAVVGDKLAGRHGNKGIISKIIADAEMPKLGNDEPLEILMNPHGVPSRINLGQLMETAVGKIADKNGKPEVIDNFMPDSNVDRVKAMLKKSGLKDTETVFDGNDGKPLGEVMVGKQFIMKLDHNVAKKFSARDTGGYTADEVPGKGDHESAQSIDPLLMYSMLSHGAKENLHEMATVKATKNDEFWRAYQLGQRLPTPQPTFAYEKFTSMMKGLGVDVVKKGNNVSLIPMTDQDVAKLSVGEVKEPKLFKVVGESGIKEEKGGLFDPQLTGGNSGNKWTHINLAEPLPNPIFEDAIKTTLGLKQDDFDSVLVGKKGLTSAGDLVDADSPGAQVGGVAFKRALGNIDVNSRLKTLKSQAVGTTGQKLNTFNKQIRYLQALKNNKMTPDVYVTSKVPVIPPKFRPIYQLNDGTIMTSDVNHFYKTLMLTNDALKEQKAMGMPKTETGAVIKQLYEEHKALAGLGGESSAIQGSRNPKGIVEIISGSSPKSGFYQGKMVRKRQDLSGRSTIINEPSLGVDEVGIPKDMLKTMFRKPVIRRLVSLGYTPLQAAQEIDKESAAATKALELEAEYRPVLLNRAPSLWRGSMQAFRARPVGGNAIKFHPLPMKSFNADVDGDQQKHTLLTLLDADARVAIEATSGPRFLQESVVPYRAGTGVPSTPDGSTMHVFNLEDFPRGALLRECAGSQGLIRFHEAVPGTKVLAMDESSGSVVWASVSHWSEHPDREIEIVTLRSGAQIVTDNDPRAVYGVASDAMSFVRATPTEALASKMLVPRVVKLSLPVSITEIDTSGVEVGTTGLKLNKVIKLDHDFGYLVGSIAGNGWVSADGNQVGVSTTTPEVFEHSEECFHRSTGIAGSAFYAEQEGAFGVGKSWRISSRAATRLLGPLVGQGARNKHLPAFFLTAPDSFKYGMLAGLMDTDGCIGIEKPTEGGTRKRGLLSASYATSSLRLAQEVQLLLASVGARASVHAAKTPAGLPFWKTYIHSKGALELLTKVGIKSPDKLKNLASFSGVEIIDPPRMDIVPLPSTILKWVRKVLPKSKLSAKQRKSLSTALSRAASCGSISRHSARIILSAVGEPYMSGVAGGAAWVRVVKETNVTWDPVVAVEKTGMRETGYDLTVPGYETFMAVDGVVLSNTMAVHVPVGDEAVKEANKMMPTQNLFNPGSGDLMLVPSQDSLLGLYKLTEAGRETKKSFKDFSSAHTALFKGDISATDVVKINGIKTTTGRYMVNQLLPEKVRDYGSTLDKKRLAKLLGDVAKHSPDEFGSIVDGLKDIGNDHAYRTGSTISLSDLVPQAQERDKLLQGIQPKIKAIDEQLLRAKTEATKRDLMSQKAALYNNLTPKIEGLVKNLPASNNVRKMVESGARGNITQVRQMLATPLMVTDTKGRPIPVPIKKSYAEGLGSAEYFIQSYGARTGAVDRSNQTSVPGYFQKRIINTMISTTVTSVDCGTHDGLEVDFKSAPKDAIDKYTAESKYGVPRNTVVTAQVLAEYEKHGDKIKVRSPLTCEAKDGLCSKCFGRREHGKDSQLGENLGTISAQSMAEPATQMQMVSFHTGGVAQGGIGANLKTGFQKILQLTELPAVVPGSAVLSEVDGIVDSIEVAPAGGHYVNVGEEQHYIPPMNQVAVKMGDRVSKGDALSSGDKNPHDMIRLKGVRETQKFLTTELRREYDNQGIRLKPSIVETAVRQLTNLTRVMDPGKSDYAPGDYAPLSQVTALNKTGLDIKHEPELKGINQQPLFGSEDWLSQLNFQNLKKTIVNAASKGWSSSIHGTNPIAAWVYGAEFGKSKEPGHY